MPVRESKPHSAKLIYSKAVDIEDEEERSTYLDEACKESDDLRREIDQLLSVEHFANGNLLSRAVDQLNPRVPGGAVNGHGSADIEGHTLDATEHPVIDRYKLLEEIGRGGMGTVYMAQQTEPIKRRVALKLINPGMDSREVIARFAAEQQALAMMDHPNIARVLDAGTTEQGRPYFVMDLVRGLPITEYCQQNRLGLDERLCLFVDVCHAVQHAHQKGIIHRDLKPSNVMVSGSDGVPAVKVIDFGVAKALHHELTDKTLFTQFTQFIGTPLYISPEQAGFGNLDVDTRSDVYSLGVLLYELLTEVTPFDRELLAEIDVDKARRIICTHEPPRPSTRLSTLKASDDSTLKQATPRESKRLAVKLRNELDSIVMKALEKDRTRRYESASNLAQDIERYRDNEPIEAKPPTSLTRLTKWSRRHRTATNVSAVAAVLFLMFASGMAADRHRKALEGKRFVEISLQAALTAMEADNIEQAMRRLSEAKTRIDADRLTNKGLLERFSVFSQEAERYARFSSLLEEARTSRANTKRELSVPVEALALYGVMENPKWVDSLRASELPEAYTTRIVEGVYELLLLRTVHLGRAPSESPEALREAIVEEQLPLALECLDKAISFHAPSRGYYWLLANCSQLANNKEKASRLRQQALETPVDHAGELFYINRDRRWGPASHHHGYPKLSIEESYRDHREMLRKDPTYYNGAFFMALILNQSGRHDEALPAWYSCVALRPNDWVAKSNLAYTHSRLGNHAEAMAQYDSVLEARPNSPRALRMVAWALATNPDDRIRDGRRSVRLASKACQLDEYKSQDLVDTLAAAHAEMGDFEAAIKWSEKAVELADGPEERKLFTRHLESFRKGEPWRED